MKLRDRLNFLPIEKIVESSESMRFYFLLTVKKKTLVALLSEKIEEWRVTWDLIFLTMLSLLYKLKNEV